MNILNPNYHKWRVCGRNVSFLSPFPLCCPGLYLISFLTVPDPQERFLGGTETTRQEYETKLSRGKTLGS